MNVFYKIAWQGLKKNRTRTLVTIIGVALSAALFTAVTTFGVTLLQYLIDNSAAKTGNWHVEYTEADTAFIQEQEQNEEVEQVASFENIGYAVLDGAKSEQKPYLFVAGFTDETAQMLPISLISGRLPKNDTEILIPEHVAIKADVQIPVGSTLDVSVGNREKDGKTLTQHDPYIDGEQLSHTAQKRYTVVGTYERPGYEEHEAPGYTVITRVNAMDKAHACSVFVQLKHPTHSQKYAETNKHAKEYVLNENVLRFYGAAGSQMFRTLLFAIGGVIMAIIMVGSVFLIYNSFQISLSERMHQIGILMSVGATKRQLCHSVLFEGVCIGAVGTPLGMLAGVGGIAALIPVISERFSVALGHSSVGLHLTVSVLALVAAACVSFVTILISAYIPAKKATSISVMDCLRQSNTIQIQNRAMKTSPFVQKLLGVEGMLALKNFRRNKHRYRSIVLSLSLSMILFVSSSSFISVVHGLSDLYLDQMSDADITLQTDELDEARFLQVYRTLQTKPFVTNSTWQADAICTASSTAIPADVAANTMKDGTIRVCLQFVEDTVYTDFLKKNHRELAQYQGKQAKYSAVLCNMKKHQVFLAGQTIPFTLTGENGNRVSIQAAMEEEYPIDTLNLSEIQETNSILFVTVPMSQKAKFQGLYTTQSLGMFFDSSKPSRSLSAMHEELAHMQDMQGKYTLVNMAAATDQFSSLAFVINLFAYVFIGMISLIATANVFNTISTNIQLRRRELAMLLSMGMAEREFNRMMRFECLFYGLQTLLFGIPISGVLSWGIYRLMTSAEKSNQLLYHFPWQSITACAVGVFCIVCITMLYATSKIKRENIIDALRDDTI